MPVSRRSIIRWPRARSWVKTYETSPYSVSLASRTASSSVSKVEIASTGPKISSRRIALPGATSDTTVGAKNVPSPSMASPPVSTRAPRATASATRSDALATALSSMSGPIWTPSSVPRPTRIAATRSVTRAANASAMSACTMKRLAAVHA